MSPTTCRRLAAAGTKAVIVCPIGFVADHIEVVWDLDNELRRRRDERGIAFARAATPNADPRFARLAVDLIDELRDGSAARPASSDSQTRTAPPLQGFSINGGAVHAASCGEAPSARPSAGSR